MPACKDCGGTEFYKEAGYFFCQECQVQIEELRDEVLDLHFDGTRVRRTRIRKERIDRTDQENRWTTWEQYNFILMGLTNELIELGATAEIKMTVLKLWATYLGKVEVAFTSTSKRLVPKLARVFHKKDAEIIYGKIQNLKKSRKRKRGGSSTTGTSVISSQLSEASSNREMNKQKRLLIAAEYDRFMQSQESSVGDASSVMNQSFHSMQSSASRTSVDSAKIWYSKHARKEARKVKQLSKKFPRGARLKYQQKHVTSKYRRGPHTITPMKLWAILYLALRIHNQSIHLADMLRFGREGHLSYYKLGHLLPPEMILSEHDINLMSQNNEITHKGMRRLSAELAKFLQVREMDCPYMLPLIIRFCQELQLPRGIMLYTERLIALSPPKMVFNEKVPLIPNYEGRALAFIIVVFKVLFGMDGITEYAVSRTVEEVNCAQSDADSFDSSLFSFREWQLYIECRRDTLINTHFPTKLRHDPDAPGNVHLYLRFLNSILAKAEGDEPEVKNFKNKIPRELANAMKQCLGQFNEKTFSLEEAEVFPSSLTPQYSYLEQLLEDPLSELPDILRSNFVDKKVGYMMSVDKFKDLAAQCDIDLQVVNSNLHFVEKVVSQFEKPRLPSIKELNEYVKVESHVDPRKRSSVKTDYLNRKNPGVICLDPEKQAHYDAIQASISKNLDSEDFNDFGFGEVTPAGGLMIPDEFESDCEDDSNGDIDNFSLQNKLGKKYNLSLQNYVLSDKEAEVKRNETEIRIVHNNLWKETKEKQKLIRDNKGRFVKPVKQRTKNSKSSSPEVFMLHAENTRKNYSLGEFSDSDADVHILQSDYDHLDEQEVTTLQTLSSAGKKSVSKRDSKSKESSKKYEKNRVRAPDVEVIDDAVTISSHEDVNTISDDSVKTFDLDDNDLSFLQESSAQNTSKESESSLGNKKNGTSSKKNSKSSGKLFLPFRDYWMYNCIFSRVKPKNFELFEGELPVSFQWLLNEFANIGEMTIEDLYEEVCLIETYHAHVLKPSNVTLNSKYDYRDIEQRKRQCKKKW